MDDDEYADSLYVNSIETSSYNRVRKNDAQVGLTSQVTNRKPVTTVQRLCGHKDTKESNKSPRKLSNYMAAKQALAKTLKLDVSGNPKVTLSSANSKATASTKIASEQKELKEFTKSTGKMTDPLPAKRTVSTSAKPTVTANENVASESTVSKSTTAKSVFVKKLREQKDVKEMEKMSVTLPTKRIVSTSTKPTVTVNVNVASESTVSKSTTAKYASVKKLREQKDINQSNKPTRKTPNFSADKRTVSKTTKSTNSGTKKNAKAKANRAKNPAEKKLQGNKIKRTLKSAKESGVKKPKPKSSSKATSR